MIFQREYWQWNQMMLGVKVKRAVPEIHIIILSAFYGQLTMYIHRLHLHCGGRGLSSTKTLKSLSTSDQLLLTS